MSNNVISISSSSEQSASPEPPSPQQQHLTTFLPSPCPSSGEDTSVITVGPITSKQGQWPKGCTLLTYLRGSHGWKRWRMRYPTLRSALSQSFKSHGKNMPTMMQDVSSQSCISVTLMLQWLTCTHRQDFGLCSLRKHPSGIRSRIAEGICRLVLHVQMKCIHAHANPQTSHHFRFQPPWEHYSCCHIWDVLACMLLGHRMSSWSYAVLWLMSVLTMDGQDTEHTRTFNIASAAKNVAYEQIILHGLTMICSLCVWWWPNWVFNLWLPVSVFEGHGSWAAGTGMSSSPSQPWHHLDGPPSGTWAPVTAGS